jgi:hypothetical protein
MSILEPFPVIPLPHTSAAEDSLGVFSFLAKAHWDSPNGTRTGCHVFVDVYVVLLLIKNESFSGITFFCCGPYILDVAFRFVGNMYRPAFTLPYVFIAKHLFN